MTEAPASTADYTEMTAELVSAYVAHNHVATADVPALIRSVHDALSGLGQAAPAEAPTEALKPAVPVKKSITDEYIISLEDGRKLKSMKRYLAGLSMTPADYRAKWGLPKDYPMVAPAYAAQRSALAKSLGLGRKAPVEADVEPEEAEAAPEPEVEAAPAPKRGRPKKTT